MDDHDRILAWFLEATAGQLSIDVARELLESCEWDAAHALAVYHANKEEEVSTVTTAVPPAPAAPSAGVPTAPSAGALNAPGGPRTMMNAGLRAKFWDMLRSAIAFLRSLQPPSLFRSLLPTSVPLSLSRWPLPPITRGRLEDAARMAVQSRKALLVLAVSQYASTPGPIVENFLADPLHRTSLQNSTLLYVVNTARRFEAQPILHHWLGSRELPHLSFWAPLAEEPGEGTAVLQADGSDHPLTGFRKVGVLEGHDASNGPYILARTIEAVEEFRAAVSRREARLAEARRLREEQDAAYRQVLESETAQAEATRRQQEAEERAASKKAEEAARENEAALLQTVAFITWASSTPHDANEENVMTALRVRLPNGFQLQRSFPVNSPLKRVFQWLDAVGLVVAGASLVPEDREAKNFEAAVEDFLKNAIPHSAASPAVTNCHMLGVTVPPGGATPTDWPRKFNIATAFPARTFKRTDETDLERSLRDLNMIAASLFVKAEDT